MAYGEAYAEAEEYAVLTGETLTEADEAQVGALLVEIADLMRDSSANLDDRLTAGKVAESRVKGISIRAVQRYLANPHMTSSSASGPFIKTWASANARGLWLSEEELEQLQPPATNKTGGARTIRVGLTHGTARQCWRRPGW